MIDPRTPVIVGVAQLNGVEFPNEPIEMMVEAARSACADAGLPLDRVADVRVVKGIWPYNDPARLVAEELGLPDVRTGLSAFGGNEAYDLLGETAAEIQRGDLDLALIASAETLRTRRKDKAAGRRSTYRNERADAEPDATFGSGREFADAADRAAGTDIAVNFYAMAEHAIRHRRRESAPAHRRRIAELWARGSDVATRNPHAWRRERVGADAIATAGSDNRPIAAPYPKLMTSNLDVDQAAALLVSSYERARASGVADDRLLFLHSAAGGHDAWIARNRLELDASPALRIAGNSALRSAGTDLDAVAHLDLYSCFPAAVQVAQRELGIDPSRQFTITGGMTFAGGPLNSYCMHALASAVELMRGTGDLALLSGNGGYFTKHSFLVAGGRPPASEFRHERPQSLIDAEPQRPPTDVVPEAGTIESWTVTFDRAGVPERALLAVLDEWGSRTWAVSDDATLVDTALHSEIIGERVTIESGSPPSARPG